MKQVTAWSCSGIFTSAGRTAAAAACAPLGRTSRNTQIQLDRQINIDLKTLTSLFLGHHYYWYSDGLLHVFEGL